MRRLGIGLGVAALVAVGAGVVRYCMRHDVLGDLELLFA